MTHHKSEDYKLSAVEYYLIEDKTQEEVMEKHPKRAQSRNIKMSKMFSKTIFYINNIKCLRQIYHLQLIVL